MYLDPIPNRNGTFTYLIRRSHRLGNNIVKTTLANVTKLGPDIMPDLQLLLRGGKVVTNIRDVFDVLSNKAHGHVAVVLGMMDQLGLPALIAPKNTRFRRLVLGMIAARVLQPASKLATSRLLDQESCSTTLNALLGLKRVDEDHLYEAMDMLAQQKSRIECALAQKHLGEGGLVLYDTTSSYVEGTKNEWAAYGYNRDKKKGKQQIVIGLMTDGRGCPVSVEVFPGNTSDAATLGTQITKIQKTFGLQHVVLVGDRGILQQKQIQQEVLPVGLDWITGMRKNEIEGVLLAQNHPRSLFDETNLMEVEHQDFPHDRLILCRHPWQAQHHREKREALIAKTKEKLNVIVAATQREKRALKDQVVIGLRVGKVASQYKVNQYFLFDIREGFFSYQLNQTHLQKAEALDGLYAIRSSLKKEPQAPDLVRNYKRLATVEMAFRAMKSLSLPIRPIHHRKKARVEAHVLLCMLSYYVQYHLQQKLAPLLFAEEDLEPKRVDRHDLITPAKPTPQARKKATTKKNGQKRQVKSLEALMEELSGLNRLVVQPKIAIKEQKEVIMMDGQTPIQKEAFKLLNIQSL